VREFVLDASFALKWCFEDKSTVATEALLTLLQNEERLALVPGIWPYEILNGLGKGVTRNRVEKAKAILFWQEMQELPVTSVETPLDETLLEIALKNNLAIYDASYFNLAMSRGLPIATVDGKLLHASIKAGLEVIRP